MCYYKCIKIVYEEEKKQFINIQFLLMTIYQLTSKFIYCINYFS
jgi:hypothetical protein